VSAIAKRVFLDFRGNRAHSAARAPLFRSKETCLSKEREARLSLGTPQRLCPEFIVKMIDITERVKKCFAEQESVQTGLRLSLLS
jgi:hypothetical protein